MLYNDSLSPILSFLSTLLSSPVILSKYHQKKFKEGGGGVYVI